MIHDIREAFNELLEENEWMDTETRHVAEDKANSMTERIGYPEYITNDTRLQEEYQNVCNGNNLSFTRVGNFPDNFNFPGTGIPEIFREFPGNSREIQICYIINQKHPIFDRKCISLANFNDFQFGYLEYNLFRQQILILSNKKKIPKLVKSSNF